MEPESDNDPTSPEDIDVVGEEFVAELLDDKPPEVPDETAAALAPVSPAVTYQPSVLVPQKPVGQKQERTPMENLAAKGGAVGALVLGCLSFVGSFITSYAILNSFMGLALGLWGLRSNHRRLATIGMLLCLVSAFFCVVEISSWLQTIWQSEEAF